MMIYIRNKNFLDEDEDKLFCSFDLYWRNLKGEIYADGRCIDIVVKETFNDYSNRRILKLINMNQPYVTLESFKKSLQDQGIALSPENHIYYRDDENDDIPIDSDSEYREALKYLITRNKNTKYNVMMIITGDKHKTQNILGKERRRINKSEVPLFPCDEVIHTTMNTTVIDSANPSMGNNINELKRRKTEPFKSATNVMTNISPHDEAYRLFQNYVKEYKKEIVDDVLKIVEKKLSSAFRNLCCGNNDSVNVNSIHENSIKEQVTTSALYTKKKNEKSRKMRPFMKLRTEPLWNGPPPTKMHISPLLSHPKKSHAKNKKRSSSSHHNIIVPTPDDSSKSFDGTEKNNPRECDIKHDMHLPNNQIITGDETTQILENVSKALKSWKWDSMSNINKSSNQIEAERNIKIIADNTNTDNGITLSIDKHNIFSTQIGANVEINANNVAKINDFDTLNGDQTDFDTSNSDQTDSSSFEVISRNSSLSVIVQDNSPSRKTILDSVEVYDCLSDIEAESPYHKGGPIMVESSRQQIWEETIDPEFDKRSGGSYSFVGKDLMRATLPSSSSFPKKTFVNEAGRNKTNEKNLFENSGCTDIPPFRQNRVFKNSCTHSFNMNTCRCSAYASAYRTNTHNNTPSQNLLDDSYKVSPLFETNDVIDCTPGTSCISPIYIFCEKGHSHGDLTRVNDVYDDSRMCMNEGRKNILNVPIPNDASAVHQNFNKLSGNKK